MRDPTVIRWLVPLGALLLGVAAGTGGRLMLAGDGGQEVATRQEAARGGPSQPPELPEAPAAIPPSEWNADVAWNDHSGPRFGDYAEWILQADQASVARTWELRTTEHGPQLGRTLDPATALLLIRWAEIDPGALVEVVGRHPLIYAVWARVDAEAAVTEVLEWITRPPDAAPNPWTDRDKAGFLLALAEFNPQRAHELITTVPVFQSAGLQIAARIEARADPAGFDPDAPVPNGFIDLPGSIEWAAADPVAVLQWLAARAASGEVVAANESLRRKRLLEQVHVDDAAELPHLAAMLPAGELRLQFLKTQTDRLARLDPDAAIAVSRSMEGARLRHNLLSEVGIALARHEPRQSVELLAALLREDPGEAPVTYPDGRTEGSAHGVNYQWIEELAITAPAETMALLDDRADLFTPRSPGHNLAREWLRYNQLGYARWVEGLAPGPKRDGFVGHLVSELGELENDGRGYFPDHPQSLHWAMRIDDADLRHDVLTKAISRWRLFSPVAAAEFLQSPSGAEEARLIHATLVGKEAR